MAELAEILAEISRKNQRSKYKKNMKHRFARKGLRSCNFVPFTIFFSLVIYIVKELEVRPKSSNSPLALPPSLFAFREDWVEDLLIRRRQRSP